MYQHINQHFNSCNNLQPSHQIKIDIWHLAAYLDPKLNYTSNSLTYNQKRYDRKIEKYI